MKSQLKSYAMKKENQILRPKQVAELLSISIPTLYRIQSELPPKIKLSKRGRAVGWKSSEIELYLESRTIIEK